jgi:hypothetical protein
MVSSAAAPLPPLDHISVQALNAAKGVQLKFWIDEANSAANGKVLTKVGTVQDLRTKLAEYYALDLACPPKKPAGPITRGQEVQKRQFAYLRELWKEWVECVASDRPFLLCDASAGESLSVSRDREKA